MGGAFLTWITAHTCEHLGVSQVLFNEVLYQGVPLRSNTGATRLGRVWGDNPRPFLAAKKTEEFNSLELVETWESGTVPYTISEESGFSYGSGRGRTAGSMS